MAVHGCFAGYTGFTVGKVSNHYVMLPIGEITSRPSKAVTVGGHWYNRLLYTTQQPSMAARPDLKKPVTRDTFSELFQASGKGSNGYFEKDTFKSILEEVGMDP